MPSTPTPLPRGEGSRWRGRDPQAGVRAVGQRQGNRPASKPQAGVRAAGQRQGRSPASGPQASVSAPGPVLPGPAPSIRAGHNPPSGTVHRENANNRKRIIHALTRHASPHPRRLSHEERGAVGADVIRRPPSGPQAGVRAAGRAGPWMDRAQGPASRPTSGHPRLTVSHPNSTARRSERSEESIPRLDSSACGLRMTRCEDVAEGQTHEGVDVLTSGTGKGFLHFAPAALQSKRQKVVKTRNPKPETRARVQGMSSAWK